MKNDIVISVICPLFNKRKYIIDTIDSVLHQTYNNWEMLIIDDGSTDDSYEIVNDYIRNQKRIKLYQRNIYKENKGGSICRNIGINLAKGTYVLFLDADDLLHPKCLEIRLGHAMEHNAHLTIFNEAYFINDVNNAFVKRTTFFLHKIGYHLNSNKKRFFLRKFISYDLAWTISNSFWRLDFLKNDLGGFDESFQRLQDPELHTSALMKESLILRCMKYKLPPDVYIRLDDNRHSHISNKFQGLITHLLAIEMYIDKFHIEEEGEKGLNAYLLKYIFAAEANVILNMNVLSNKELYELSSRIKKLQKKYGFKMNRYIFCMQLLKFFRQNTILRKTKIDSLIYKIYSL